MKNIIERMKEENTEYNITVFRQKQGLPYDAKIAHAEIRAREFYQKITSEGHAVHVSVGGLDSITLLLFLRKIGIDVPAVSVSVLEDKSIQRIHKELGVIALQPQKNKTEVLQQFGFPVLSKEIASKIDLLQRPSEKNKTVRHAIITGETGEYGGNRTGSRMKLPQKWLNLFAGYENENESVNYRVAPFKVSDKCCYYLKEKPCDDWAKQNDSFPYLGLMASEGGRREKALMMHGCNYYGKTTTRSAPFAVFNRQDLLRLALELDVPVPEIYGSIERSEDGTLYTTKAQRTGCSMCGFGIHLEKRPHRFDLLRASNPREWEFWMMRCVSDPETGEPFGWGRVLDYIGVPWRDVPDEIRKEDMPCPSI